MDNWYLLTVKQMPFLVVTKHNNGACTEYFFYHLKIISDNG